MLQGRLTYSESATSEEDEKEEEDVQGESFYDGDWVDNKQHGIGVRQYRLYFKNLENIIGC